MSYDNKFNETTKPFQVEFAVEMTCDKCKNRIEDTLKSVKGVKIMDINVDQQKLLIEFEQTSTTVHELQSLIESKSGMKTVVKGIGDKLAAVSEVKGIDDIIGVVRFTQMLGQQCLVDGVIDGMNKSDDYSLNIHEYGDLSGDNFENVGRVYVPVLGRLHPSHLLENNNKSRASFKLNIDQCDLSQCIGRSLAVSHEDKVVGAGIVARASTVGSNLKKICACSGRTLWDERTKAQEDSSTSSRL